MSKDVQIVRIAPPDVGLPEKPITEPWEAAEALAQVESWANLLAPAARVDYIAQDHALGFRVWKLDAVMPEFWQCSFWKTCGHRWEVKPDAPRRCPKCEAPAKRKQASSNGTFYVVNGGAGLAMHKSALDRVAAIANVQPVRSGCSVVQVERYLWRAVATVQRKEMDGQIRTETRSKELDLRDDSPQIKKYKPGKKAYGDKPVIPGEVVLQSDAQILEARRHGAALAETKAHLRAVRALLGIRAYSWEEAARPFVCPVPIWIPDTSNPEIARLLAARELGLVETLYGQGAFVPEHDRATWAAPRPPALARPAPPPAKPAPAQLPTPQPRETIDMTPPPERERVPVEARRRTEEAPPMAHDHGGFDHPICAACKVEISVVQHDATVRHFKRPLCSDCRIKTTGGNHADPS